MVWSLTWLNFSFYALASSFALFARGLQLVSRPGCKRDQVALGIKSDNCNSNRIVWVRQIQFQIYLIAQKFWLLQTQDKGRKSSSQWLPVTSRPTLQWAIANGRAPVSWLQGFQTCAYLLSLSSRLELLPCTYRPRLASSKVPGRQASTPHATRACGIHTRIRICTCTSTLCVLSKSSVYKGVNSHTPWAWADCLSAWAACHQKYNQAQVVATPP